MWRVSVRSAPLLGAVVVTSAVACIAAASERSVPPLAGSDLRLGVRAALVRVAEGDVDSSARELVTWHEAIVRDTTLASKERTDLRQAIRRELATLEAKLRTRRKVAIRRATKGETVLAQAAGGPPGVFGAAAVPPTPAADYGEELADLIRTVIAPATWDTVGGDGAIQYWQPGHALVIRQTTEVHEQIGQLLRNAP